MIQKSKLCLSLLVLGIFVNCSNPKLQVHSGDPHIKILAENRVKKGTKGPLVGGNIALEKMQGSCMLMKPPGKSESLFEPCNQVALQLIYQQNKQTIISIIRTESDGKFELNIPKNSGSGWNLSSTSMLFNAEVDLVINPDSTRRVIVILKPSQIRKGRARHRQDPERS